LLDLLDSRAQGSIVAALRKSLTPDIRAELDAVIQGLDDEKHQKRPPGSCDPKRLLEKLGNACKEALSGWDFGYFEDVRKAGFQQRFSGTFRIADGAPPFHRQLSYEGAVSFSEMEAVLVRPDSGEVLSMSPLYVWIRSQPVDPWLDCMVFDGMGRGGDVTFKKVGAPTSMSLTKPDLEELSTMIQTVVSGQVGATRTADCQFVDTEETSI
jgi:hypothetical protein